MKKNKIVSIKCGIGIIITTIIMIIRLPLIAQEFSIHQTDWSLDVESAVRMTAIMYGVVICIFTIILVLANILKNKINNNNPRKVCLESLQKEPLKQICGCT